ncbi:MAG: hypothetical protein JRI23_12010 [Deltaproteobacteria bacterium]|jgi:hypothetical protein|nr:hypothetical protein [Deltaproteobacteria bacterium]MBW2532433.1 hypothetical protein [Deltaproteobacteria bacterium]
MRGSAYRWQHLPPRADALLTVLLCTVAAAGALLALAATASAAPPPNTRDDLLCRANSAVGFSYWWGGSCWCANGCNPNFSSCSAGSCSGNCPSCTHYGSYGADCSGFVNKVWQVPDPIATTTCGHGPYVASDFKSNSSYWNVISRSAVQPGDALASTSHVILYHYGDPWGSMMAYEARGCAYGVIHTLRSCSSEYSAARRINLVSPCQCSPGQVQTEGCGNCGTRQRTCQASCQWGSWSACAGQGPCSPGATQTRDCCDCGTQTRSCDGQCDWGEWSACAGPDPAGDPVACETGLPGPCAAGSIRCIAGCLECASDYTPTDEVCDGIDNDCNDQVDDGQPSSMGASPPEYAARLVDLSYPARLEPGEVAQAWVTFTNEGSEHWTRRTIWLAAARSLEPRVSDLYDRDSWPAWDTAAVLDRDVAPGQDGTFRFDVRAPDERGVEIAEQFALFMPDRGFIRCPAPTADLVVRVGGRRDGPGLEDEAAPPAALDATGGCSCRIEEASRSEGDRPLDWGWLGLAVGCAAIGWGRSRRPARRR